MKCPLENSPYTPECNEENCAIWDEDKNCCSTKVIARELTSIVIALNGMTISLTAIARELGGIYAKK